jgi:hypothetical protein
MGMTEVERLLDVLLHDLRTPLGVASGFVRLVKEGRLPSPAESDRALEKVQDALRTINGLCTNASEWLQPADQRRSSVRASVFVADVDRLLGAGTLPLLDGDGSAMITLRVDAGIVAQAVCDLLRAAPGEPTVALTPAALRFASAAAGQTAVPFDPWTRPGLGIALACRRIDQAGGTWRSAPRDGIALAIELPIASE